jgi:hypothetical protein
MGGHERHERQKSEGQEIVIPPLNPLLLPSSLFVILCS